MHNSLPFLVTGGFCLVVGLAALINPRALRRIALRYHSGGGRLERYPFGGQWMKTHEREHILSLRFSGLLAVALAAVLLYVGITRH